MAALALRKKLQGYIETMPERNLIVLKPLLAHMAADYWKPVIEPASKKEAAMIDKRVKEYKKDPSSFVPFKR